MLRYVGWNATRLLTGKWKRYGRAAVVVGEILTRTRIPNLKKDISLCTVEVGAAQVGLDARQVAAVDDVETYRGWFQRLDSLMTAVRTAAIAIASIVGSMQRAS